MKWIAFGWTVWVVTVITTVATSGMEALPLGMFIGSPALFAGIAGYYGVTISASFIITGQSILVVGISIVEPLLSKLLSNMTNGAIDGFLNQSAGIQIAGTLVLLLYGGVSVGASKLVGGAVSQAIDLVRQ